MYRCFYLLIKNNVTFPNNSCHFVMGIEIMFADELNSIYEPITTYYKRQLQLNNKHLLNKWFVNHFNVCYSEITV